MAGGSTLVSKLFSELSASELYEIIKARFQVFVLEQKIMYQDLDDVDYRSLHVYYERDGKVSAYLRAFESDTEPGTVQIGRMLTVDRGAGLGLGLLRDGLLEIRKRFYPQKVTLDAQSQTVGFYEKVGFTVSSEEFIEAGIPHIKMTLELE